MTTLTKQITAAAFGATFLLMPKLALAQEAITKVEVPALDTGNTAWMMVSTVLVLFMTIPALALFYGGMVRKQNILATLMQSFSITVLCTVIWAVVGYSLAFGNGGAYIGDLSKILLVGLAENMGSGFVLGATPAGQPDITGAFGMSIPEVVFMMFQMTFAIITPALIIGAVADRIKFSALLIFVLLWSLLVYAPVAHWVWQPNGFLFAKGVLDFAGGSVVHINSGIAALVACLMLGRRQGYGTEQFIPHNLVLTMIGASMLWVGWFGFNAGSAIEADGQAGMAFANTHIATAMAALTWMLSEWFMRKKPSLLGVCSGAVAGLVGITPAAGLVGFDGAFIIGLAVGGICFFAVTFVKSWLKYDDSLDVFGVHGIGGLTGAILTGVFAKKAIGGYAGLVDGNAGQVWLQVQGALAVALYSAVVTAAIIFVLKLTMGVRVAPEIERDGLDRHLHGEGMP
jgi:Amt family ammonium transporter